MKYKTKPPAFNTKRLWRWAVGGLVVLVGIALIALVLLQPSSPATVRQTISPADYQAQFVARRAAHTLLDVRTPEEYATGHIASALNISLPTLSTRLAEVPRDKPVVVYCRSGNRSAQAAQLLAEAGYTVIYDLGGINTWTAQGYAVEP